MRSRVRAVVLGLGGVAVLVLGWALAAASGSVAGVPAPADVATALGGELTSDRLWSATAHTLLITLVATAIAAVLGVVIGAVVGMSPTMGRLLGSSINSLRFIPPVALIPVVLLVMGFGAGSEVTVAVFAAVWPVLLNVAAASESLRTRYDDLTRIARLSPLARLTKIFVPGAIPATVVGLRVGAALALILVIAVEMLAVPAGLGHEVRFAGDALQLPSMYAYIVWIGLLGVVVNTLINLAQRALPQRGALPAASR
ncbi:ABC transporter permease [Blastococcus haudaquaticus]|uniref:ABC-type nitrate/sulfonate/bicarbonate transport system, permease component n=1 Tax=Blastococcus haudaquaticus TaxID=1938745 RepID=A0A286GV85_9ACTN|nr:ABC transporter permease subunit [Blastococcus haudaquaticus]SOD99400.1 ABC-type nitrate/sulfonate/bicarbonate transport system, permease component [Blastococcus haudaquaticus]